MTGRAFRRATAASLRNVMGVRRLGLIPVQMQITLTVEESSALGAGVVLNQAWWL
jgi:hypothetical protein